MRGQIHGCFYVQMCSKFVHGSQLIIGDLSEINWEKMSGAMALDTHHRFSGLLQMNPVNTQMISSIQSDLQST